MNLVDDARVDDRAAVTLAVEKKTATITIANPRKLNALTPTMLQQLERAIGEVSASEVRVVVVRAADARAFCVGADISAFAELTPTQMWREWTARGHRVFQTLAQLHQPTIAVMHGHAFGGGLELALACDFRVLVDDARIALPEVGLGTVPGWGGTERLTELIERARAKEVVMTQRQLDAATAERWGAVTRTCPSEQLDATVDELLEQLLAGAPLAVELAKQLIDAAANGAPGGALEPLAGGLTATTDDLREGITAFHERRPADFNGR
jgi:enoyl-CoA hydratase